MSSLGKHHAQYIRFRPQTSQEGFECTTDEETNLLSLNIYTVQGAVREIPSHQKNVYLWFMAAKRNVPTTDPPPHIKRPHDLFEVVKSITTESFP